ncbi:MAG TPA: hypothetical protein ENN03_01240 [bacterium]|nr:hypothetical protein [bacterium]
MPTLIDIVSQCLLLERLAAGLYRRLPDLCEERSLHPFWESMARQEREHVRYWEGLLELCEKERIPQIFDEPESVLDELKKVEKQVQAALKNVEPLTASASFLLAYRIEFFLMHPAFEALFHLMRKQTKDRSPEDTYEQHIQGLLHALEKMGPVSAEFRLIGDMMNRLWNVNRLMASQLSDIRNLRGLIPICMHCKNVRNDEGYWGKVENYVESRSRAQFSHGICPECMRKYYSEYMDDES